MTVGSTMEDLVCYLRNKIHPGIYGETLWGVKEANEGVGPRF